MVMILLCHQLTCTVFTLCHLFNGCPFFDLNSVDSINIAIEARASKFSTFDSAVVYSRVMSELSVSRIIV